MWHAFMVEEESREDEEARRLVLASLIDDDDVFSLECLKKGRALTAEGAAQMDKEAVLEVREEAAKKVWEDGIGRGLSPGKVAELLELVRTAEIEFDFHRKRFAEEQGRAALNRDRK